MPGVFCILCAAAYLNLLMHTHKKQPDYVWYTFVIFTCYILDVSFEKNKDLRSAPKESVYELILLVLLCC